MEQSTAEQLLRAFWQAVYETLGRRKDALFELLEAAVVSPGPATLVQLSLTEVFRRQWASASTALAAGPVFPARSRTLIHSRLDDRPVRWRPVWAGDGTTWPRPAAKTSPERTWGHRSTAGSRRMASCRPESTSGRWKCPRSGAVGSVRWMSVVTAHKLRHPQAGTPAEVAVGELRVALARRLAGAPRRWLRIWRLDNNSCLTGG